MDKQGLFQSLGIEHLLDSNNKSGYIQSHSPIDGQFLGSVRPHTPQETSDAIGRAQKAFEYWRYIPAPKRGELIGLYGQMLQQYKEALGTLVTLEMGKILE